MIGIAKSHLLLQHLAVVASKSRIKKQLVCEFICCGDYTRTAAAH
jgi:hypothetical protein